MRLDKYLAEAGIGTRSQVKVMIRKGRITVDGQPCRSSDEKIDEVSAAVRVDGQLIHFSNAPRYLMLHKPAGVVSATMDKRQKTVLDLLEGEDTRDLFPVGRLDIDTEGLLLLTDDGQLAHELLSPKKHVEKTYEACVTGTVDEADIQAFSAGLDIGEKKPTLPAKLQVVDAFSMPFTLQEAHSFTRVTIAEGKFHQIKRMFQTRGKTVLYLRRVQMGSLVLDPDLAPGAYRALTEAEIAALKAGSRT